MFQKTYTVAGLDEIKEVVMRLQENRRGSAGEAKGILVNVSAEGMSGQEIETLLYPVKSAFPDAVIVGATDVKLQRDETSIAEDEYSKETTQPTMRLSFCAFEQTSLHAISFPMEDEPGKEALLLCEMEDEVRWRTDLPKAVLLVAAGLSSNVSLVVEGFHKNHPDIPMFGALYAGYQPGSADDKFIFGREIIRQGYEAVFFYGESLHVSVDLLSGWIPLGREFSLRVRDNWDRTACGESVVYQIDDKPAAQIYKNYLNVVPDRAFIANIAEFPLTVQRDGMTVGRIPFRADHAGQLYFSGDVTEKDTMRFAYATPTSMLHETELASRRMQHFSPEAVLLFGGLSRDVFLGSYARAELECYQNIFSNTQHSTGIAQIYAVDGKQAVFNGAVVAVGFHEEGIDYKKQAEHIDYGSIRFKDEQLPLKERLSAFLNAMTADLEEAVRKEEKAGEAKTSFLSNMSHEIRTPINAIIGLNEMVLRESSDEAILGYANDISSAGSSLLGIVNDILDFSKIEAGKLSIIPVEYKTSGVLSDLITMIGKRAADKGLALHIETDPDTPEVLYGDEIRIKQIVTNLLTNAVKYTEKGSVTLTVRSKKISDSEIKLQIRVKDTGIGIKEEERAKLFTAFERLDEKRNRTIEGTGLGMSITLQLLHLMGSELHVDSTYGVGSEFYFTLRQKVVSWNAMGELTRAGHGTSKREDQQHALFTAPEAKILVVDDTVMNLTVVKALLRRNLLQIDTAESGLDALAMVRKNRYDLVFLDFRMPGMDGIETLHAMQEEPFFDSDATPVICLTANAVSGAREQYEAAGFVDMLTKPIAPLQLEKMLLRYLPKDKAIPYDPQNTDAAAEHTADVYGTTDNSTAEADESGMYDTGEAGDDLEAFKTLPQLNLASGIANCGDADSYRMVLETFASSCAKSADVIEGYWDAQDTKNYTIKVHALKSSARIIGANGLSDLAAFLEKSGNTVLDYQQNAGDVTAPDALDQMIEAQLAIMNETPGLLAQYRTLGNELGRILGLIPDAEDGAEGTSGDAKDNLEEIAKEDLQDAMDAMTDAILGFDYRSLEYMTKTLEHYRLPADAEALLKKVKAAMAGPDWDALQSLIQ